MSSGRALPPLPPREEVFLLIMGFLRDNNLAGSLLALEEETGVGLTAYGAEMGFLKKMVLGGDWEACISFLAPLKGHAGVDHAAATCAVHTQHFFERLEGQEEARPSVPQLVGALQQLEAVAAPTEFQELCYIMTLSRLQDHPQHRDWTVSRGRLRCFARLQALLEGIYPPPARAPPP
eukprot:CAMPEP_0182871174 /NCGR_PEP_ID=MMETSP0034_2-20130328/10966_1 /TAXON_ID=156128 /ORGANISM="Nephroselmis pyriformis, Strain CCMP717" /LENGTH=177 /DNA_ID=CAMNT_0025003707 /DNA_START=24 /DNA_END=554 /DNA_ORIENTATION=-